MPLVQSLGNICLYSCRYSCSPTLPHLCRSDRRYLPCLGSMFWKSFKKLLTHRTGLMFKKRTRLNMWLRQGICKAYSGILRGMKDPRIGFKVATHLFKFMEGVWADRSRDKSVMHAAVAVLTDFDLTIGSW
uniref:Importin subunit beta-1/Transportin-1-like TPR repeats domain-containing protein n=1 Tax=Triticum urartu TaxID=4572 RepID=A0A8R7TXU5_TRIUA